MAPKNVIGSALRAKLLQQKRSMDRGGVLIDNKNLKRLRFRVLPPRGVRETPGVAYTSYYCKGLDKRKSTTSPLSWGLPCPIADALQRIRTQGSEEDRKNAKEWVRSSTEYWIPGIDRSDEGTPDAPKMRILRAKHGTYQTIIEWMLDEEDGDDITHPTEGRDIIVKREGTGLDTEWKVDKCDRSPIARDKEMVNAWLAVAENCNPVNNFFPVDKDVLSEMYRGLTGEDIPEHYMEGIDRVAKGGSGLTQEEMSALVSGDTSEEVSEETGEQVEDGGEQPAEDAGETATDDVSSDTAEGNEDTWEGQRVSFEDADKRTILGTVIGPDPDDAAKLLVAEDGGSPDEPWAVDIEALTVIEADAAEAEEPEEVAPAAPVRRAVTKPAAAPAPKPTPAPKPAVAPKPAPKPVGKPAAAPAAKPATTSKPAPKPATSKVEPRRPASSAIRARLNTKKK